MNTPELPQGDIFDTYQNSDMSHDHIAQASFDLRTAGVNEDFAVFFEEDDLTGHAVLRKQQTGDGAAFGWRMVHMRRERRDGTYGDVPVFEQAITLGQEDIDGFMLHSLVLARGNRLVAYEQQGRTTHIVHNIGIIASIARLPQARTQDEHVVQASTIERNGIAPIAIAA